MLGGTVNQLLSVPPSLTTEATKKKKIVNRYYNKNTHPSEINQYRRLTDIMIVFEWDFATLPE